MDNTMAAMGGLAVGSYLIALFFIFSYKTGVLASFGRRPLDNKRFLALSAAAFLPGIGCLGSMYLGTIDWVLQFPPILALAMATVAVACRRSFMWLEAIAMEAIEESSKQERLAAEEAGQGGLPKKD